MKKTNRILSMLLAVIMVVCMLPVSVFAADAATIVENGVVLRYLETAAEVSFYPTSYDSQADWQYYYLITEQDAEKTADDVKVGGTASEFDEVGGVATFDVTDLAAGIKYIHIVMVQRDDATQISNVLKLEIPEFVPLTITPSADGYELESGNTLTVVTGTTVTFTTSESGCGMEYKEGTTEGPALEFVGNEIDGYEGYARTATFSELGTYTIEASINYKTAECTIVVVDDLHQHSYSTDWSSDVEGHWHACSCGAATDFAEHTPGADATAATPQNCTVCGYVMNPAKGYTLTLDYSVTRGSNTTIGHELDNKIVESCTPGEVVDLSQHWPEELMVTGSDGETYYFFGFAINDNNNGTRLYTTTMNENQTVYALWVTPEQITVELNPIDGTLPYARTRENNVELIYWMNREHTPVRTGYDFVGWSLANDGTADPGDTIVADNCTLYAVWYPYNPSYDDDYFDPLPGDMLVNVGDDYSAILRDDVVIIRGDEPISGTLDLGKANAEAIRLPGDVVSASTGEGNSVIIKYPDGTTATITGSGFAAAEEALKSGESLQIALKNAGSEVLPDSLTEEGAYGGIEANIDKGFFIDAGIAKERLIALGLINNINDSSISEQEFEYLYHRLTTNELLSLKTELNTGAHFDHHQKAMDWLDKMIERDATVVSLSTGELDESGIRDKLEAIGYTAGSGLTLGLLRQADLDMDQLEYIKNKMQEFIAVFDADEDKLILAWANEAIAQKELEATYAQMDEWIAEADAASEYYSISEIQNAIKEMTTDELETFLAKVEKANAGADEITNLSYIHLIISNELEARQAQDAPTYVNTSGTSDGINPLFIGAVEVNIGAVKVDGTTTPIAIRADRSDAVAWSTNVDSAWLEEKVAEMKNAMPNGMTATSLRAYKVLENGTLESREIKVVQNANGTLTLRALSDGNSTYVFLLEPEQADVDDTPTTPEIPNSPQTGDNSHMWLWVALLFVSGMGLIGTTLYGRKRRTN